MSSVTSFLFFEIIRNFYIDVIVVIVNAFCPEDFEVAFFNAADGIGQFVGGHGVSHVRHKLLSFLCYSLPVLDNHVTVAKSSKEQAYFACMGNFLTKAFYAVQ